MRFIAFNLMLLYLIIVGAGTYLALGTLIKISGLQGDILYLLYSIAAVLSVMASYYVGKFSHRQLDRYINRNFYRKT